MTVADARPLRLIQRFIVLPRNRGRSLYWHEVDSRPCLCETLHGHGWAVRCKCGRHEGEISRL